MVKATTPQKQMQVFREEALRVKGLLEARKLVERIMTEMTIWETRLSCSEERLSETEAMFSSFEERLDERLRAEVLRRESEKVRLVRKVTRLLCVRTSILNSLCVPFVVGDRTWTNVASAFAQLALPL